MTKARPDRKGRRREAVVVSEPALNTRGRRGGRVEFGFGDLEDLERRLRGERRKG